MVDSAVDAVAASLHRGDLVVLESTTYPGTAEDRVAPRIAAVSGLQAPEDYHLIFSPERIDPGNPFYGLQNRVADILNRDRLSVNGARILVLGVAYKRNMGDLRESPAPTLIARLENRGAIVRWHDPHLPAQRLADTEAVPVEGPLTSDELAAADRVIIHTDHSADDPARVVLHSKRVFDTRNMTAHHVAEHVTRL